MQAIRVVFYLMICRNMSLVLECISTTLVSCPGLNGSAFEIIRTVAVQIVDKCQRNETGWIIQLCEMYEIT